MRVHYLHYSRATMLKSTFTPIFCMLVPNPKSSKLSTLPITNTFKNCPPPVRQNASLKDPVSITVAPHLAYPTSAYVHLPFCRKRCHYCDFPIVALGSASTQIEDDPRVSNYVQFLCREIDAMKVECDAKKPLETVFFGGGTPSLVPARLVSKVLEALSLKFGVCEDAEISMEMDPGTFDARKMKEMMGLGVNRVSLGVQAFQEKLLRACGRAHGVEEVYESIGIVKSCGVENWSIDLISSLPHQTNDMWEESLRLAIEAQPTHVSVYDLQIEQGTKFGTLYTPGELPLPSETQSADFYKMASRVLCDADYNHYEISSYCKSGYECKHNFTYWKNKPYYGFGLGSASFVGGLRFSRPKKVNDYMGFVQSLENGLVNCSGNDHINVKDTAMDVVMLSLRTAKGIDLKCFQESFGSSIVSSLLDIYKPYFESGHVVCLDEKRRPIRIEDVTTSSFDENIRERKVAYIRLNDPEGFLLSNELISLAFEVIDSYNFGSPHQEAA
ncbi:oxygen-independent coproporphyrinogen-III oxidase-like protein sll1917 [Senna tora]|uniref:Radical S-adenosyl methionine domain-containing protein 1, mitochondrial n=1 Tax=Senna tora TaxID=362788 RepID=A0A834X545_9FABA|nr:oxygen-independent coproporphyrinogen-III oxidase-like protein sll1917 [Senna tora]